LKNSELEYLLDLHGEIYPMDNGHWTKFEVNKVKPTEAIPHGIKYSLTLHDRYGKRVLGFDNAHGIKLRKGKFGAKKTTWDHEHQKAIVKNYEFESPGQLLEDFWAAVDKYLGD
jgi:hypothetical protein